MAYYIQNEMNYVEWAKVLVSVSELGIYFDKVYYEFTDYEESLIALEFSERGGYTPQ